MMKRFFLIVLGVLVLAAAGTGIAINRLDPETLRGKLAELSKDVTGKPLYMAQAPSLSLMPLGVSVGAASWGYDDGKPSAYGLSVEVKSAIARLELWPLLSGKIVVKEVRLDKPQVTLRPEKTGAGDTAKKQGSGTSSVEAGRKKSTNPPLELERLNISNGTLLVELEPGRRVRVDSFNASVADLRPGAEASVKMDMSLLCAQPALEGNFALAGYVRLVNSPAGDSVNLRQTKVSFTPLAGLIPAALGTMQLAVDGNYALVEDKAELELLKVSLQGLALEATGSLRFGQPSFGGSVKISAEPGMLARHLGMTLPAVPGTGRASLHSAVEASRTSVRLTKLTGDLDGTSLSGDVALVLGEIPLLKGVLRVGHVDMDAVAVRAQQNKGASVAPAPAGAAKTVVHPTPASGSGQKSATVYPQVALDISVASFTAAKVKLENIHGSVQGRGGKVTEYQVNPLELQWATGGTAEARLRGALPAMQWAAEGRMTNVALGPLLQAVQGKRSVDGTAEVEYALQSVGSSGTAIKANLSGKGSVTVTGLSCNAVSVLPKALPAVATAGVPTSFERLYIPFVAQKGVLNINGMSLTGKGLSATGKGVVRLPQENLNMAATITVLGTQIPVQISGPFANLSYAVDPKWAARVGSKLGGALLQGGKSAGGAGSDAAQGAGELIRGLLGR